MFTSSKPISETTTTSTTTTTTTTTPTTTTTTTTPTTTTTTTTPTTTTTTPTTTTTTTPTTTTTTPTTTTTTPTTTTTTTTPTTTTNAATTTDYGTLTTITTTTTGTSTTIDTTIVTTTPNSTTVEFNTETQTVSTTPGTSSGTTITQTTTFVPSTGNSGLTQASAASGSTAQTTAATGATTPSLGSIRTSTPLTSSADTTTVSQEPPTTTPYMPLRKFPPVISNRYRINYWATCNHYWQFSSDKKIVDRGSDKTFVRDQVNKRRVFFNNVCGNSTSSSATSTDTSCCVACADEDLLINVPGFTTTDNITNQLNGDLSYAVNLDVGLDASDSMAVQSVGTSDTCIRLGRTASDAPYGRLCLQQPEKCDYGLSASVWVNFTFDTFVKQVLLSTLTPNGQGFQFYTELGKLTVLVVGAKGRWMASVDGFDMKVGKWRLLGFTWDRSTGVIQIYIDSDVRTFFFSTTYSEPNAQGPVATDIMMGCELSATGTRSFLRANIIHPALWFWPIEQDNLILLTGALVYKLIKYQAPVTTPLPTTPPTPSFAYSTILKEARVDASDPNPYYKLADFYLRGYDLQGNVSSAANNITVTEDFSRNTTGFAALKFTNSPAMFTISGLGAQCIGNNNSCPNGGISMSLWIAAVQQLPVGLAMEVLRFNVFAVTVSNSSSGDVALRVQAGARYLDTKFKFQKWVNIGFVYDWRGTVPVLTGYVNGISIGSTSDQSGSPLDSHLGKLTFGSASAPAGVMLTDFAVWYRALEDFEVHKFLGYTRDQLRYIREATYYWTTDDFVLADGLALTGTPSYNLMSQYRLNFNGIINGAIKFEPDRYNKSVATKLDSNWYGQIFLGNEFSKTPTEKSIMWYGNCLTDPYQRPCQISGLAMHMWINIKSVDPVKKQFFFSSGDLGDARSSTLDSRGISLFTTGNLLGASLSTDRNDWAIVIDSNRYDLNEWFNIGFTWREQEGMRLFLNGTDYGIKNLHPDISYKAYDKHTRAVVGRFDDDQNSTWKSNSEWVMGNFSYSDVVFYNRWMSPEEFSRSIGSINNRYYVSADLLVFGQDIIDTEFLLMKQASLYGVPIGPQGSISSQSGYALINTNGEIGIKAYTESECPRSLSACTYQVLFSTWIQVVSKANETSFSVMSLGSEFSNQEGFGLNISSDGSLSAWVKRRNNAYKMVTRSTVKVRFNRWLNLGLFLAKTTFYPTIYLNGTNVSMSLEYVPESAVQANTAPGTLKLGLKSSTSAGAFLAYVVSGWYGATILKNQMNQMLGMQSSQYDLIVLSDDYWTVSGIWNKLQPRTLRGFNVLYNTDKFDMENGAMCTAGSGGSYISLGDLQDSCLQNTAPCKAYILTMNFKPTMPTSPGRQYFFSSGGQNVGHLGTAISVTSDGFLFVTVRSANKTCESMVPFNYSSWVQLQVRWYSEATIAIKVDEETISSRVGANCTCWQEWNNNSSYSEGQLGKVNSNITNASAACFSDVMFMYQLLGSSGSLDVDVGPANCYEQQTVLIPLYTGGQSNFAGKPNRSRLFSQKESVDIGTDTCLFSSAGCQKGIVLSFWLKVNSLTADTKIDVFSAGYSAAQGVQIRIVKDGTSGYRIVADASLIGKLRHVEGTKVDDQIAFGAWVNVGLSVSADAIELFQNGIRVSASTRFDQSSLSVATGSTVSFGSSSAQIVVSDLVIWNDSPLNCLDPNKNRKLLTGDCSAATLTLASTCMPDNASSCASSIENNMCLDPRFNNVVLIDKSGQLFSSQQETNTACGIIYNTATDNGVRPDFVQSSLNILTRISANLVVGSTTTNETINSTVGEFSRAFSAVFDKKFSGEFGDLVKSGSLNPARIFSSIETFATRLAVNIKTDCSPVVLTAGRMHWSTQKISAGCSGKDNNRLGYYDVTRKSWDKPKDAVYIQDFLTPTITDFFMACVVYDGIEKLISSSSTNETSYSSATNSTIELTVNSRVISMWLSLPIAAKPVNFTLMLLDPNLKKKDGVLKYETRCAFWNPSKNVWSTDGCYKDSEDENSVNCRCDHMTSFAILMQPVPPPEDNIHARILSILTYILLTLSLICLLIFIIVIACSKRLRGERYILHLNLAAALFVAQLAFIFTQIAKDNVDFCKAIAIIMHLFFVATFAMLFLESLWVFYAVTKGIIRGRLKWWLPVAWLIPVVIVGVVGGINSSAYGGPYCWITGIYIWAFLGPLVAFGCLSLLVCLIVVCNLSEPAIKRKDILNDLRNHTHQCAFLIPLMILAWLFGILLVQWYNIPIEYFFVIFNASQGIWVFLGFGCMNPDFREVICLRRSRSSVASSSVSITGVQDIHSSKTSFETGSQVAIVPQSASPKRKAKKQPPQESRQETAKQEPQQQQQQPQAPVYYTGKPRKQPPQKQQSGDDDQETTSSRARLQAGSARSLRSETDADRPGTPRVEKFTPPGTVE